jgi:subtilisin-like proprotein convertase family protein
MPVNSIDSIVRRRTGSLLVLFAAFVLCLPLAANAQSGTLLISEFRVRGPNGANDEFVEIYNNSGASHTVAAASGTGYGLAASDGVTRCTIPNGTIIPDRGHYLCVNSVGYSLASYPAGGGLTATGNATYTTDIPDNAGIALFNNNTGGGSYALANRFDAVGSTSEANATYKEGTGYPALTPFSIDSSFTRRLAAGCTGSAGSGNCTSIALIQTTPGPTSTQAVDTNNNAADFIFVDTNGTSAGAGQRLGAPGPANLSSPIARDGSVLTASKLDSCEPFDAAPNLVRDFTSDPANNSTFGTLDVRRRFTNTTGLPLTRLRFRLVDITTFPSISGVADLRPRTSSAVVVTVDRSPCGSATTNPTVQGTTLEQPPSQPNGSGFNGSLSVGTITSGSPLAVGASVDVRFLLGIQQTGAGRFCVAAETLPASSSQILCIIGPTDTTSTSSNSGVITIPTSGPASPYPSTISVTGLAGTVTKVTVTLTQLNHSFASDVDVLLVSPTGVSLLLLSDVGFDGNWVGHTYTFDSTAAALMPELTVAASGTYRPTNYLTGDTFPVPAPAGPYTADSLTVFNGPNPNGTWSLYVVDDTGPDAGNFNGGWSLTFTTVSPAGVTQDFNGDGTTDIAVFRPSTGVWYIEGVATVSWGASGDIPVAGDYDGNGTTDVAVYRPSTGVWYAPNQGAVQYGIPGDIPVPADYNGAGSTERAVYRPSTGMWYVESRGAVQWGERGDIPVPGDYDGDLTVEVAVYRPTTGMWFVPSQAAVQWGVPGDIPVPGDYNGDLIADIAVYRPSSGTWFVRGQAVTMFGAAGDIPVPGDYNDDGSVDRAVYRPSDGRWYVQNQGSVAWGIPGDLPIPQPGSPGDVNEDGTTDVGGHLGDFDGNGSADIAVFRSSTGSWYAQNQLAAQFGAAGDVVVAGDYNGDGTTDRAIYRPSEGRWYVQSQGSVQFGGLGDIATPGDYNGDGTTDRAVYSPSSGIWSVEGQDPVVWGAPGDVPVPGDYNGDGVTDIAVYRPSSRIWYVINQAAVLWGIAGGVAVPGDYNGDGVTDRAVYDRSTGTWWVENQAAVAWGAPGDLPVPGDFNGDGTMDRAVYRPSNGTWFVRGQFTVQWGIPGDIPASRAYGPR